MIPATEEIVRFGLFELELKTGMLRKNGIRIRLHQQPLQVLALLLERSGEVVTRQELQQRLWSGDVFVDFDHGLNKSVQKLREALGDSADSSRYIETIPRVGYRFIAPVRRVSPPAAQQPSASPYFETPAAPALAAPAPDTEPGPIPSNQRWILVIAGVSIAVMLTFTAAIWLAHRRPPAGAPIHSLAVLPLVNLSGDPAQEYFADGMTDELTTMLAKNSTLQITSRTSVMQYKGVRRPLREVATALGVDGILEGSISRSGDKLHMTIQLIQAPTDTHVWAESYDRSTNDAVSLPLEAAQAIARRLNTAVLQPAPRYVSPEAHDAYLHGRYLWYAGKDDAKNYFEKATQLQPDYALGWSGLADYYGAAVNGGRLKPSESFAPLEAAARKAVELDDSLSEAHNSMAAVYLIVHWDWVRADQEAQRAIQLDPRSAEARHFRAKILAALNRHQEAIEVQKKATELDPFARPWALALSYNFARQYDAALQDALPRLQSTPEDVYLNKIIWSSYRCKGMYKEAVDFLEKAFAHSGDQASAAAVRRAFEGGGYPAVLHWQLEETSKKALKKYVSPVDMATLYGQLGDREKTLALLEEAYNEHSPRLLWIQCDSSFDFLHTDERHRSIIKKVGVPPAW